MLLLEIAAQGVKGVSPAGGSARLRPGYNIVSADGAVLRRLLEALFYPGDRDGEALRLSAPAAGSVRAGVTLVGNDGVTYRVVRDFAAGCQLHRFDPEKRAFALVSQDGIAIARHLEATGAPARERLALLAVSAAELPSRCGASLGAGAALAPPRKALTPAQAQKRLAELYDELDRANKAEKLQYQLDGLQSRLFKLEEALKEGARIREGVESAEAVLATFGPVGAVAEKLGDVDAKLAAHAKAVAKRDEALAKIELEKGALEEADVRGLPLPFWMSPKFWMSAGAGVVAAVMAIALSEAVQGLRYVALLDIPAFGWAAWMALGWVAALEDHGRLGRRRKLVEEHERKVLGTFDRDVAEVRKATEALGVAGIPELREAVNKLSDVRAAAAAARERLQAFEATPDTRSAQEEKVRVEAELREVEPELAAQAGGFVRDPRSVTVEIQRLEAEAAAEPEVAPEISPAISLAAPADPIRELMERAAKELGGSPAAVVRTVQTKASQLLQALSGDRFTGLGVDDRGNLLTQAAGRSVPAAGLPPADRDMAFLALKLAFIERALSAAKLVALADDAFAGLPESARRRAGRILKQLAASGQLLHATTDIAFRESADHLA